MPNCSDMMRLSNSNDPELKPIYMAPRDDCTVITDASYSREPRKCSQTTLAGRPSKYLKQSVEQHKYYVALVQDETTGRLLKLSSHNLKGYKDEIIGEASEKFINVVQAQFQVARQRKGKGIHLEGKRGAKRKRPELTPKKDAVVQAVPRPLKIRKAKTKSIIDPTDVTPQATLTPSVDQIDIPIVKFIDCTVAQKDVLEKWFNNAFRAIQQVSCRIIAKEWIKLIHPKKQSTHPYNGKNFRTGIKGDPDSTKPRYWPKDVIHREPDHINKEERVKLLVHLLMNTPHKEVIPPGQSRPSKAIDAAALKAVLDQKSTERAAQELKRKLGIVETIIFVRTQMEQFQEGGLPADTSVSVPDYQDAGRGSRNDCDSDELEGTAEVVAEGQSAATSDADDDDDAITLLPHTVHHGINQIEQLPFPRPSIEGRTERRVQGRRRRRRETEDLQPEGTAMATGMLDVLPQEIQTTNFNTHVPIVPRHHSGQPMFGNTFTKMAERMHAPPDHNMDVTMHDHYPPTAWAPECGQIPIPDEYNDAYLVSPGSVSERNSNIFIGGQYSMMPHQQSFCGNPPFFQPTPSGATPYHYMQQLAPSHDPMISAYYP